MKMMKMKSILFLCLFTLGGCLPKYTTPVRVRDYAYRGALFLPVSEIHLDSLVENDGRLPHVENQMPMSPERSLKNWAFVRLRGNYEKPFVAQFLVKKAQMLREDAPEESFFVYDNYKYTLEYEVVLNIKNKEDKIIASYESEGTVAGTLPMKSSINERDAMFVDMLDMMVEDLDKDMSEKIKQNILAKEKKV